ncbi:histone methylation DOT1, partial [Mycena crocata]
SVQQWTITGIPKKVLFRILRETYERSVQSSNHRLNLDYKPFSNHVYGELGIKLLYDIFQLTQLTERSLFMDLGCGIGNTVIQASLQTGCQTYGIEIGDEPSRIGRILKAQFQTRCRMWGVQTREIELEQGDMLLSDRVAALIPQADVVLINNYMFDKACELKLNSLKNGAYVVSLQPFGTSVHARIGEREVDNIFIPFCMTRHYYPCNAVRWTSSDGNYYLHEMVHRDFLHHKVRSKLFVGQ